MWLAQRLHHDVTRAHQLLCGQIGTRCRSAVTVPPLTHTRSDAYAKKWQCIRSGLFRLRKERAHLLFGPIKPVAVGLDSSSQIHLPSTSRNRSRILATCFSRSASISRRLRGG